VRGVRSVRSEPARREGRARRVVVGVTGGSGAIVAVRLLEALRQLEVETHLVVSERGAEVLRHETGLEEGGLRALATRSYANGDLFAPIASGTFRTDAMVVVPCSMRTLAGVAHGLADSLLLRAADVCLKERRRLVLVARETPLSLVHLENMRQATLAGAVVLPPVLTFYTHPKTTDDMVATIVGKALDAMGIEGFDYRRWP